MIRITLACPEALIGDANQLARCLGSSAADAQTYGAPRYRDATGARYAVASGLVPAGFLADARAPLTPPPWGADMDAAARAQACIALWQPPEDPAEPPEPWARPDRLAALVSDDPQAALAILGLTLAAP
ncbi:hypothetical protein [Xinfangfangia pollutisoli]|uniref:hypothetical protein n=1 Tax=Xinfangfangia pollutisoli TaxID=2865960 RepID=UPI001CD29280|nr:hypothetical protein [Xinfangfangia pollutisoli]